MSASRCLSVVLALAAVATASPALAGSLSGKLDLPNPPDRPPLANKGFTDRVVNAVAPIKPPSVGTNMAVVLESDDKTPPSGGLQVTWELAGDAFTHPVLAVPVGTEVVIRNTSPFAHILAAAEDPKLIPAGPINKDGPRTLERKTAPGAFTIGDSATPHLKGKLVVVDARYTATVDDNGKFDIADLPGGTYKLRIYYFHPPTGKDGWLDRPDDTVTVPAKGRAEVTAKVPAGYPIKGK